MRLFQISFICALTYFFTACKTTQVATDHYLTHSKTAEEIKLTDNKLEKVFYLLVGEFSNKAQADTTTLTYLKEQEMIGVPIWRNQRKGEYWLYLGWFQAGVPERALEQSILHISKLNRDTFMVKQYALPNEEAMNFYPEEWKKPDPFAEFKPKDLILAEDCITFVVEREANRYEMLGGKDCPKRIGRNIHFFDYRLQLTPDKMNDFTIFYDANKKVVLVYPEPYGVQFMRVDKNKPRYFVPEKKK